MHLLDKVAASAQPVIVKLDGQLWHMPGAGSFAATMEDCSRRYILHDDMRDACRQVSARWPDLLHPENNGLRVPSHAFWLEWSVDGGPSERRLQIGVLVEAAADGRSGVMRSFWSHNEHVDVAQAAIRFDLDRPVCQDGSERELYHFHWDDPRLAPLAPHLSVDVDESWRRYFRTTALGTGAMAKAAQLIGRQLCTDIAIVLSFACLLSSQIRFAERRIDRAKLNATRIKSGKAALLDHSELRLGQPDAIEASGTGRITRTSARLHMVRGHLVRRNHKIFWRTAHLRGRASRETVPAVTRVRMAAENPFEA